MTEGGPWLCGGLSHRRTITLTLAYCLFTAVFTAAFFAPAALKGRAPAYTDFAPMDVPGYDYLDLLTAAAWYKDGLDPYLEEYYRAPITVETGDGPKTFSLLKYNYPPSYLLLFMPLTHLSFETGYRLSLVGTVVFLLASIVLISRFFPEPWAACLCGALLCAQSSFLAFELERGQTNALILMLVSASLYLCLKKDRQVAAGLLLSLAAILKLTPLLFLLLFLARRKWRCIAATMTGVVLLAWATGIGDWVRWVRVVMPEALTWWTLKLGSMDHSLVYFLSYFLPSKDAAILAARLASWTMIGLYAAFAWAFSRDERMLPLEIGFLMLVMNLSSPWSANYKLLFLISTFLAPLALTAFPTLAARPLLVSLPFFLGLALVVPAAGPQMMGPLHTVLTSLGGASLTPLLFERKTPLGLVLIALWFLGVFGWLFLAARRHVLHALLWSITRRWGHPDLPIAWR